MIQMDYHVGGTHCAASNLAAADRPRKILSGASRQAVTVNALKGMEQMPWVKFRQSN